MKNTKKYESGRSMIEMVGVLAVTGLLTAGAFVLIQSGMASQKRARAADEISALVASARSLTAESPDFRSFGSSYSGEYKTWVDNAIAGTSAVTLNGNPQHNAKRLLNMSENVTPFGEGSSYAILGAGQYLIVAIEGVTQDDCEMMKRRTFTGSVGAGACSTCTVASVCPSTKYVLNIVFQK